MRFLLSSLLAATLLFTACKTREVYPDLKPLRTPDPTAFFVRDSLKYLLPVLDSVLLRDQRYRYGLDKTKKDRANKARLLKNHAKEVDSLDNMNLRLLENIVTKHGWMGAKDIGVKASSAMFMVLQHADIKTQERYRPVLKNALFKKKILPAQYAMFTDRIEIRNKRPQIYGSQIAIQSKGKVVVLPMIQPDSVDARRKSIGIKESMNAYLGMWNVKWDVEQYKKDLPKLVSMYKIAEPEL